MLAILSDIHANAAALEAVLADLGPCPAIVAGDSLNAGPRPVETLALLEELRPVARLRGNHEDYIGDCLRNPGEFTRPLWRFVPWTIARLGAAHAAEFLATLQHGHVSDDGFFHVYHASEESRSQLPAHFPYQASVGLELPPPCVLQTRRLMCVGHSHLMQVIPGETLWLNTGSVGYAFLRKEVRDVPHATYLRLHFHGRCGDSRQVEVEFRAVPYSQERLIRDYLDSGALEECLPYSLAILAQSLFNEDITWQVFRDARERQVSRDQLPQFLTERLESFGYLGALRSLVGRHAGSAPAW